MATAAATAKARVSTTVAARKRTVLAAMGRDRVTPSRAARTTVTDPGRAESP
jgi:hypothetical protein